MTLPTPDLDDRRFEELLRELQQLIPTYTPELARGITDWTDWNESDPGTTLIQLWAHVAEVILHRLNRLPDLAYVKFLELVGLQLRPARAATVDLTFTPQPRFVPPPAAAGITVPRRTQVLAQPPAGGEPLTFETVAALDLVRAELASVQVADGGAFTDVTELNGPEGTSFRPLGWTPQLGNALYLGFAPPDPPINGRVFPDLIRLRVFGPATAGHATACDANTTPPAPPATLEWEYRRGPNAVRWRRLETYEDGTNAFTRGGYLVLEGPSTIEPVAHVGAVTDPRLWIRVRLTAGSYPSSSTPEIDFIRPNTVRAENLATIRHEALGESEGHPDQSFVLGKAPMQPESLVLEIAEAEDFAVWEQRRDLLASAPNDPHYTIDGASGTVRFGDGRRGRIPVAGALIVAREYRYGASAAGNMAANLITTLDSHVAGVQSVTNPRPSLGGADVQDIDQLRRAAPAELRTLQRAVTSADYAALAVQLSTVARATALPLTHPEHRNVDVPGAVTVVIVPDGTEAAPQPSPELVEEVCRHLNGMRTISTELHVVGPRYRRIKVVTEVQAEPYASAGTVEQAVKSAINGFLDPLGRSTVTTPDEQAPPHDTRGPGREFGLAFAPTSLFGVILDVQDVASVPQLWVELDGSPWDDIGKAIPLDPDELLYGADNHEIAVVPRPERTRRGAP
ncbi:putative baseplate assembly protein [Rhodococcus sp. IEGM 1307]|uniref:putative baseplate assembly protein n=1 Tax=Rhodococcus sp. IEGM 1307 TaxID=3047091 RepID=UPI0024B6F238|nr:putative baseplate assembly protein [Rhodococcus sp. IEGM 1307]MDI9978795.1 putative baseplate assembly protein [Rhodococcus sp. IEGM 1307]